MPEQAPNIAQTAISCPSLGRIVIHRGISSNGAKDHPAIVNRVFTPECVNLTVFPDCGSPVSITSQIAIDPTNQLAIGWFWPPRV